MLVRVPTSLPRASGLGNLTTYVLAGVFYSRIKKSGRLRLQLSEKIYIHFEWSILLPSTNSPGLTYGLLAVMWINSWQDTLTCEATMMLHHNPNLHYCLLEEHLSSKMNELSEKYTQICRTWFFGPFPEIHPFWRRQASLWSVNYFDADNDDPWVKTWGRDESCLSSCLSSLSPDPWNYDIDNHGCIIALLPSSSSSSSSLGPGRPSAGRA